MSYRVRAASRWASSSLPCSLQLLEPLVQLLLDRLDGPLDPLLGQDEVLGGIDVHLLASFRSPRR